MARVTVYGSPVSPFVEKVRRGLALKKVDSELVPPKSPFDLRRWNPQTGKMPVVEIDGERTYDSTFILRRLDALFPEPPLVSTDPATAAGQRLLEDWSDEALYFYVMALRWSKRNTPATAAQITEAVPALLRPLVRPLLARQIGGAVRAQGLGRLPDDVVVAELAGRLDDLVALLGDRPFFFADRPSVADLSIFGMLTAATSGPTPEANRLVGERPPLGDWMGRVDEATRTGG